MTSELLHVRHSIEVSTKPEHGSSKSFHRFLRKRRQCFTPLRFRLRSGTRHEVSCMLLSGDLNCKLTGFACADDVKARQKEHMENGVCSRITVL